jgi:hypothetical protein
MKPSGRLLAIAAAALSLAACWAIQYGPERDNSRFVSVRRNAAGVVLYTAQDLVYRPAAGMNAYPDGGIPLYLTDRNVIGRIDPVTGRADAVYAKKNTEWQNGQGQLNIHDFNGNIAVVVESGQRRDDYLTDVHYYLLDLSHRRLTPLPLKRDFQARGRDVGYFYLLDARGTLLFVTPPLTSRKVDTPTNELWLRKASGEYVLLARGADYYGQSAGGLVYWHLESRTLLAYDLASGSTRSLARNSPLPTTQPDVDVGVGISTDGKVLELSRRHGGAWQREKTLLTIDQAK